MDNCCTCPSCSASPCTHVGCCETFVWKNIIALMQVLPGFRPFNWDPGTSEGFGSWYSEGTDQSYFTPDNTYTDLVIRWTGFSAYTNSTTNTPAWVQVEYKVHADMGDIYSITVTDSSSNTYQTTLNDDGSTSTTGSLSSIVPLVSLGSPSSFSYASGTRTETFAQYNLSGSGDTYFDAHNTVTYTLSGFISISDALSDAESAADALDTEGIITVTSTSGSTSTVNLSQLSLNYESPITSGVTYVPLIVYAFNVRTPSGISQIYAKAWFSNPGSGTYNTPYISDYLNCTNSDSTYYCYPAAGKAVWTCVNPWGSAALAGCPPAEPIFDPNANWPTSTSNINVSCLGYPVALYFEISNSVTAYATVIGATGSGGAYCYCQSIICYGYMNYGWAECEDVSCAITGVTDYNMNTTNSGPYQGTFPSCGTTVTLTPGGVESPYTCPNAHGVTAVCSCLGGALVVKGSSAPTFGFIMDFNAGCGSPAGYPNCGDFCGAEAYTSAVSVPAGNSCWSITSSHGG